MRMKMKPIQDSWMNHLEDLPSYPAGKRLSQADDRFWASMSSDNKTCVIVDLSIDARPLSTGEITASILSHGDTKRPTLVIYRLLDENLRDKFLTMFAAITTKSGSVDNTKLVNHIIKQIFDWAAFLSPKRSGMSDKELQGLWGELFFLKNYLLAKFSPEMVMATYVGIRGAPQDIATPSFYVEIKTTLIHAPKIIKISSLEQLDPRFNDQILLLFLLSRAATGLSIANMIADIEQALSDDLAALYEFKKLVSKAIEEASEQQLELTYTCLNVAAWEIRDDFPSLRRSRVDSAILAAQYDIQVSALEGFRLTESIEEWIDAR